MAAIANHPHRVSSAVADVRATLGSVATVPLWSMDPVEMAATLDQVQGAKAQLAELEARLLAHADQIDIAAHSGATSTANWHAHATRTTRAAAHRALRLSKGLEAHDLTRTALATGRIHTAQAEAILNALADLPDNLDAELVEQAERQLLELAAEHDAKALKILGRRILEVASPDAADAHEAALLEREERDAQAATRLVMYQDGHGKVHGRFTLDTLTGAMLKKHLYALAAPKHRAATEGSLGERRPTPNTSATPSPS